MGKLFASIGTLLPGWSEFKLPGDRTKLLLEEIFTVFIKGLCFKLTQNKG